MRFLFLCSSPKDDESVEMLSSNCCWSVEEALVMISMIGVVEGKEETVPRDSRPPADCELVSVVLQLKKVRFVITNNFKTNLRLQYKGC